jgi:hypothetical protein
MKQFRFFEISEEEWKFLKNFQMGSGREKKVDQASQ